jgi:hypothetical protein
MFGDNLAILQSPSVHEPGVSEEEPGIVNFADKLGEISTVHAADEAIFMIVYRTGFIISPVSRMFGRAPTKSQYITKAGHLGGCLRSP